MVMEANNLVLDKMCIISNVEVPPVYNIFTIQAKGFMYGSKKLPNKQLPHLKHYYELPGVGFVYSRAALMAEPPSTKKMQETERVLVQYAEYYGILTKTGLQEHLPRPIANYYCPPLVQIVADDADNVRAILLDTAYALFTDQKKNQ